MLEQCIEAKIASAVETLIVYGPKVEAGTATPIERKEWEQAKEAYNAHQIYRQGMKGRPLIQAVHDILPSLLADIWATTKVMLAVLLLVIIVVAVWAALFGAIQALVHFAYL